MVTSQTACPARYQICASTISEGQVSGVGILHNAQMLYFVTREGKYVKITPGVPSSLIRPRTGPRLVKP